MSTTAYMTLNRAQQRLPHGHSGVTTIASSVCGPPQSCHLLRTTTSGGAWGVTSGDDHGPAFAAVLVLCFSLRFPGHVMCACAGVMLLVQRRCVLRDDGM